MVWFGAIIAIGVLIVVHEAGHYFVARWCKMRVDRFSVGFGPAIWSKQKGDTTFMLAPIPFGGYVQIRGMLAADEVDADDPYAYPNRPAWQRFLTIFAGPATNYLFAVVLALGLYNCAGIPSGTSWYQVHDVTEGYDAEGKLQPHDRIVAIGGEPIYLTYEGKPHRKITEVVQETEGAPIAVTVLRDGREVELMVTPKEGEVDVTEDGQEVKKTLWLLGVRLASEDERVEVGILAGTWHAISYPVRETAGIVGNLSKIVSGEEKGELTGPVGIASYITQSIEAGWITMIRFLMMLNVMLGLFNLFPLPALDGGRLVFLGYEMATRRRPNPKIEATVHMVGIMALLLIMVLVTFKDIKNLL